MNRAIITGYGVASPVRNNADSFLNSLKEGTNGIVPITRFDVSETGITLAGEVKDFPYDKYFIKRDSKRMGMFSIYGIYTASEAMEISGSDKEEVNQDRFGVIIGSGIGGLPTVENQVVRLHKKGAERVSSVFAPMAIANMAAENIALRVDTKGICTAIVIACVSGTSSVDGTLRNIKYGYLDIILAGGTGATTCGMGIAGFAALTALSESADLNRGSIPSDENRGGFVMGEEADVLVPESLEHTRARGARIYGEIVGYNANYDAYHMTAPIPGGSGASKAMRLTMEEVGIQPEQIGYINTHGTSMPASNQAEAKAIQLALGENFRDTYISSTKSMTKYLLGTTGGIETLATLMALEHQFIPPTINVGRQDLEIGLTVVKNESKPASFTYVMSNSLRFGRHNAVLYIEH